MKKIIKLITSAILCVSLTACSLPFLGSSDTKSGIVIAGGNTSERQILSEIQKQLIQHYMPKAKVSVINNLGSTTLIVQTFMRGICNVSAGMYTGTSLTGELGMEPETNPQKAMELVKNGYKDKFNMKWYDSYGFSNTYAFMVKREFAEKNNIKSLSDLKALAPKLRAGVDTSWMRRQGDGYEAFKQTYGYDFAKVYPMEIGLVYDAVNNGEMDLVLGYSTDGRINSYDLVLLEDDLHVFPPYDCSPVASYDLLNKHPELDDVFSKLEGKIDSSTMQKLNRMSDEQLIEPATVAKNFLEENNYFEEVSK